jgi:hypothetical protein
MPALSRLAVRSPGPITLICSLITLVGCGPGPAYKEAAKAEKLGEPQIAYEDFCQAARKSPGSGGVAEGIKRTAPAAAAYWQTQAWRAMTELRYADAWRLLMKVLEIRPNDTTTATLILQLQAQHPTEVAEAQADWLRRGSAALPRSTPLPQVASASPTASGPAQGREAFAKADSPAEMRRSSPAPRPVKGKRPSRPADAKPADSPTGPPNAVASADTNRAAAEAPRQDDEDRLVASTDGGRGAVDRPSGPSGAVDHSQPAAQPSARDSKRPSSQTPPAGGATVASPFPQEAARAPQGFLSLRTLSKKDKRFPKEAMLIDGVVVKLKGTDDDPEADLDLFDGKKRIKKLRGLRIGASQTFPGHSGVDYRLIVLAIHDKTQTVRVGVQEQPASPATR